MKIKSIALKHTVGVPVPKGIIVITLSGRFKTWAWPRTIINLVGTSKRGKDHREARKILLGYLFEHKLQFFPQPGSNWFIGSKRFSTGTSLDLLYHSLQLLIRAIILDRAVGFSEDSTAPWQVSTV